MTILICVLCGIYVLQFINVIILFTENWYVDEKDFYKNLIPFYFFLKKFKSWIE
jgi:hypothetical protein